MKPKVKRIFLISLILGIAVALTATWRYAVKPGPQALCWAATHGDVRQVNLLLDKGAEVDGLDGENRTALMDACYSGKIEVVRVLITRGADVDKRVNGNETPLLLAQFQPDIGRLLRKAGAKDEGK